MRVIQSGRSNSIVINRLDASKTITSLAVVSSKTGTELYNLTPANDDWSGVLAEAITAGSTVCEISTTGEAEIIRDRQYQIVDSTGRLPSYSFTVLAVLGVTVETEGEVTTTTFQVEAETEFPRTFAAGTSVKSLYTSVDVTPTETDGPALLFRWKYSDDSLYTEEVVCVKNYVYCPLSTADLVSRFSALEAQEPTRQKLKGVGWQPQIDDAWAQLMNDLYYYGVIIDRVRSVLSLKELLFSYTMVVISNMGLNPIGANSITDAQTYFVGIKEKEFKKFLASKHVFLDQSENDRLDATKNERGCRSINPSPMYDWRNR